MLKSTERSLAVALAAALIALSALVVACGGSSELEPLSLVAYSTPQEAYEEIIPAFQKTAAGKDVDFKQSYGASGDQARAVEAGLSPTWWRCPWRRTSTSWWSPARSTKDWANDKYDGFVTNSVVVFTVRKGNPKNIRTWDDLCRTASR